LKRTFDRIIIDKIKILNIIKTSVLTLNKSIMKKKKILWLPATLIAGFMFLFTSGCEDKVDSGPFTLRITVSPNDAGTVTGAGEYSPGESVTLSAVPTEGYNFYYWRDPDSYVLSTNESFNFVMPSEDITLNANFLGDIGYGSVTDIDGNVYRTVKVGNRDWMAENLRTTSYRDGTAIPNVTDDAEWGALTTGAYSLYDNASAREEQYGILYNWYAVQNDAGLCPTGWRIPSDTDWTILADFIESFPEFGPVGVGRALKSCRQVNSVLGEGCATNLHPRWTANEVAYGTDNFGFAAMPGGNRSLQGNFSGIGGYGFWWTSTQNGEDQAWSRSLHASITNLSRTSDDKPRGYSIRCIRQ
jgi:uncharacterized protein (TIGR02145 family)